MISGSGCAAIPAWPGLISQTLETLSYWVEIGCRGGSVGTFVTGWRAKYPLAPSYFEKKGSIRTVDARPRAECAMSRLGCYPSAIRATSRITMRQPRITNVCAAARTTTARDQTLSQGPTNRVAPDVKIREQPHHISEKYLQLARDAQTLWPTQSWRRVISSMADIISG